jgi:hypothetical protein
LDGALLICGVAPYFSISASAAFQFFTPAIYRVGQWSKPVSVTVRGYRPIGFF